MNTKLQKLEERKDYLERELFNNEKELEEARKEEIKRLDAERAKRVVKAFKGNEPFVLRYIDTRGYIIFFVESFEITRGLLDRYVYRFSGSKVMFDDPIDHDVRVMSVENETFPHCQAHFYDVFDVEKFKEILTEHKKKLNKEIKVLNLALSLTLH